MIESGKREVPITNPDATRFFMRVAEAVDLVLSTLRKMNGGELAIPTSLPAYRVADVAEAMGLRYSIVGLPAHEKLHESLSSGVSSAMARRMSVSELREVLHESA
jgi:UDP-N-acetylglucosamine 4,6-dehydratase